MHPIFKLPENRSTCAIYLGVVVLLSLVTFGSLARHMFESDDARYLRDASAVREDPSLFLSPDNSLPGRPVVDVIFLLTQMFWENNPVPYHILMVILHVVASLLLAYTFRRLGIDLELSFLGGLFFLMNVTHFRAVHEIACMGYPLALILGLLAVIFYREYLESGSRFWIAGSASALFCAILAHASISAVVPFLIYLTWRANKRASVIFSAIWPLGLVALVLVWLISYIYSQTPQAGHATVPGISELLPQFYKLLWFLNRLYTTSFWLHGYEAPSAWDLLPGALVFAGVLFLALRKDLPISDWAVWSVLMILPFVPNPFQFWKEWYSLHLYLASAGSSIVLAWLMRLAIIQSGKWLGVKSRKLVFSGLLACVLISCFMSLKRGEAVTFYHSGRHYLLSGQNPEMGLDLYRQAVAQDIHMLPTIAKVGFSHGESFGPTLEKAVAQYPNSPVFKMLLGASRFLLDDPNMRQKGEQQIQKALKMAKDREKLQEDLATVYQNIAVFYHNSKRHQEAVYFYTRALHFGPNHSLASFNLGNALYVLGRRDEAIRMFQKAARLDSRYTADILDVANGLHNRGRTEEAVRIYRAMIQIGIGKYTDVQEDLYRQALEE